MMLVMKDEFGDNNPDYRSDHHYRHHHRIKTAGKDRSIGRCKTSRSIDVDEYHAFVE